MDVFRNMALFVAVASAGGFRAAADRLGLPNSTVSRRIAELERDIGLRLFNRTTRKVELTEAGQIYFKRCRQIADEARFAHEELRGMVTQPTGRIRASLPVDFALVYLAGILADFTRTYPSIDLDLDISPRQTDLVAEPFDVTVRIGLPVDRNLIARKLAEAELGLFAAPKYLAPRIMPQVPHDLLVHCCLRMSNRPWSLSGLSGAGQFAVLGPVIANNVGLLQRLALEGVGIAPLPIAFVADDVASGRLLRVLPDWQLPKVEVYALTETRLLPAKVRVFIDFLATRLRSDAGIKGQS